MPQLSRRTREIFIPVGATKVADKTSDAVAFLYAAKGGRAAAVAFHVHAAKPDWL